MTQLEIHYPDAAGHKGTDTGRAAAREIEAGGRAQALRVRILAFMREGVCCLTADEIAEELGESVLSVRPRVTELKARGLLVDTGIRRPSSMGKKQAVFAAAGGRE